MPAQTLPRRLLLIVGMGGFLICALAMLVALVAIPGAMMAIEEAAARRNQGRTATAA